jgi:hypothetical protein
VPAARGARDVATALATKCRISNGDDVMFDECDWTDAEQAALRTSALGLRDAVNTRKLTGAAATFVEQVRLFADWVELVHDLPGRGTLLHYQELALAWNAWRSSEPIAPDPVAYPKGFSDADAGAGGDAGPFRWTRCAEGACIRGLVYTYRPSDP